MPALLQKIFPPRAVFSANPSVRLKKALRLTELTHPPNAGFLQKPPKNPHFWSWHAPWFTAAAEILHSAQRKAKKAERRFEMRHRNLPPITWRSLTAATIAVSLFLGILAADRAHAQVNEPAAPTALAQYTRDITALAEQGRFDSLTDQAKETSRALAILAEQNNPSC
jgi:ATP-dependent Clp protease ATP-binding subunit ClpA